MDQPDSFEKQESRSLSDEDSSLLDLFHPVLREWWLDSFSGSESLFTLPQRQAVPLIGQGKNVLICSPTGSGKTLSAFISIINQLLVMAAAGKLQNAVYCLYISPLKSLANDIHRNLERPMAEMKALAEDRGIAMQEIRHSIRHGDVSAADRARMLRRTPHILNTTPESLAILLSSPRFREKLGAVKWVIVDEIHSLAASKRGLHLSISLERLEELKREVENRKRNEREIDKEMGKRSDKEDVNVSEQELGGAKKEGYESEKKMDKDGSNERETEEKEKRVHEDENKDMSMVDPASGSFVRIGCSATVEPLQDVADFLAGNYREVSIVDCRFSRPLDLRMICPVADPIQAEQDELSQGLYELLHRLIQDHGSTLIFANSRNGAERVLFHLRQRYPRFYNSENSACHHGSMGREGRMETERRLKQGDLKVVSTSTSLELGIDMPSIDLVVQIGSPKSVAALLQRFGRGGHRLNQVVKGRIIALDREDLIECAVMLERAKLGIVERIHIPRGALDALCQHLVGMALERDWEVHEILAVVRRSYCYSNLREDELEACLGYLSSENGEMKERHIYPKIRYNSAKKTVSTQGGSSRMIYYTNSGMIPDQFTCEVLTRAGEWVGRLDEGYIERLEAGDIFSVGGRSYSFRYRKGGKIYVDSAEGRPSIPIWSSERLPLSYDLARAVLSFQADLLFMMKSSEDSNKSKNKHWNKSRNESLGDGFLEDAKSPVCRWLERQYHMDKNCARIIYETIRQQEAFLGEDGTPTHSRIVVQESSGWQEGRRAFFVLSGYGLRVNEGLARMASYLLSRQRISDIFLVASDSGFVLSVPEPAKANLRAIMNSIKAENCEDLLYRALSNTSLLKSVFRINATRSFLILRSYKGRQKSARRQQFDADMLIGMGRKIEDFPVLDESFREIIEDRFEIENIKEVLRGLASGEIEIVMKAEATPSPLAFDLALLGLLSEARRQQLLEMQSRVLERISQKEHQPDPEGRKTRERI